MDKPHFKTEILRLSEQFGAHQYSEPRCLVIWSEVKSWPNEWFTKAVSFFLGEFRSAPLIQDFRDFSSKLREQFYLKQKEQFKQDSKDFWASTYHSDEIKWIVETIKNRIKGKICDGDWEQFRSLLKQRADESEAEQRKQRGHGI